MDGKGTKLNFQNGKNRQNDGNCENDKNGGENGKTVNNCSDDVSQEEEWGQGESEPLEASFLKDEVKKMVKISSRLLTLWIQILHACLTRNMNYF